MVAFTVRIDGSCKLKPVPAPVVPPGSHVVPSFEVTGHRPHLVRLSVPGTPAPPIPPGFPITEAFLQEGKNLLQLTNFGRKDTFIAFLNTSRTRAFFIASADPLGTNPHHDCEMFSIDTLGSRLRQVTRFNPEARPTIAGCFGPGVGSSLPGPPACSVGAGFYRAVFQDPVTKAVVFESSCDPLGANPFGGQVFAMRPDGLGLRQLTDASGITTNPDGSISVEFPGPFAYSAALH